MTAKTKGIWLLSIESFLLFCFFILLGGYPGPQYKLLAGMLLYALFVFLNLVRLSNRVNKYLIILIFLLPALLIGTLPHIIDFHGTLVSLPGSLSPLVGCLFAVAIWRSSSILRYFFIVLLLCISGWGAYEYNMWLNQNDPRNFIGYLQVKVPFEFICRDRDNRLITNADLKGKIVVLEFWRTRSARCFLEFPKLQQLYHTYKDDGSIAIWAVNKPMNTDTVNEAFQVITNKGYSFPVLLPSDETLPEKFGVADYPTVVIVDKSGTVAYTGDIETAENILINLLHQP